MKKETLKHLENALELIKESSGEISDRIKEEIMQAIRLEAVVSTAFNWFEYTSKDYSRACGLYHDKGYRVATDGRVLVAVKEKYPEENEGKIMEKTGAVISPDMPYPNWKSVIPGYDYGKISAEKVEIDLNKAVESLKECKLEEKTGNNVFINVHGQYFRPKYFKKLIGAMKKIGENSVWIPEDKSRPCLVKREENVCILMPINIKAFEGQEYISINVA